MESPQDPVIATATDLEGALAEKSAALHHALRQLEIEAALERLRTVALKMRAPRDLLNVCTTLYGELETLGFERLRNAMINIHHDDQALFQNYDYSGTLGASITDVPYGDKHPAVVKYLSEIRKAADAFAEFVITPGEMATWQEFRRRTGQQDDPTLQGSSSLHYYLYAIGTGAIGLSMFAAATAENLAILRRVRDVFDLAYQRYMDLTLAEARAREAEIEAALDSVRAQAMAMQHSSELQKTARILFEQFTKVGETPFQTTIGLFREQDEQIEFRASDRVESDSPLNRAVLMSLHEPTLIRKIYRAWKEQKRSISISLTGKELTDWVAYRNAARGLQGPDWQATDRRVVTVAFFSCGVLSVSTSETPPTESIQLLERFAGVFDLAYTRFQDLQRAEVRAREAEIEAALEKVRGRAMAMHSTGDLAAATAVIYTELRKLGIVPVRCGVVLLSKETRRTRLFATSATAGTDSLELIGSFEMAGHPSLEEQYECWLRQENFFTTIGGEELRSRYELLRSSLSLPYLPPEQGEHEEHGYFFSFSEGQFYVWAQERYADEAVAILSRFKTIVELTFRRYLDLQRAEAQAREAQIEASLERVRSRTLAMQKSDELAETAAVLFRQLIALGIEPNRLYIGIMKNEAGRAEFWITDEDGSKVTAGFSANLPDNASFQKMYKGWKEHRPSLTIDMQGEELQEYFRYLKSLGVPFKGGLSQKRRVQTIAFFSQGFIGLASPDLQPEETARLLERFAYVFNLTFTRFNDLQLAEAHARQAELDLIHLQEAKKSAEEALAELRATQEQLVQQEKLASLGQLTAGIAHEIKNPLNFVNNFSAVSAELVDEAIGTVRDHAADLDRDELVELLSDVKTNLTKIVEHGTRADSIVKSMLHHSRGGSGKMELTDLNALLREYVNLAYHGMRARKDPITVTIKLELDETVGKVPMVAEEFSRVIVNVCQNAFDAMREKAETALSSSAGAYNPTLIIRSRKGPGRVILEIEDNGPGIPEEIRDKILQPFFTTKKGTQGTGLGLSITHDIIKAHRGDLAIARNESGGATFAITLPSPSGL